MRVMIVDNDEAWVRSLELLLRQRGYDVTAFTEPALACDFINQIKKTSFVGDDYLPDALILDYLMPHLSGFQVLGRIGDLLRPDCTVVFVTGHGEQVKSAKLSQMGVVACLEKPVDLDQLVEVLEGRAA